MTFSQKCEDAVNVGIGAGAGFVTCKYVPRYLIKKPMNKWFMSTVKSIPEAEHILMWENANDAFQRTNLPSKDIKLVDVQLQNCGQIIREMNKKMDKEDSIKWLNKWFKNQNKKAIRAIAKGENAGYVEGEASIFVNKNKLGISTFHEIGHAITWKAGGLKAFNAGFGNILGLIGIPLVLGVGLLKNKKKDGEETKGFWDKTTTFVKNHCAAIMGIIFIPTLADEAMASMNGAKIAKNVLDNNMYKKLNKFNGIAYSSYIASTLIAVGFTHLAVKLRDKIVEKRPIKFN